MSDNLTSDFKSIVLNNTLLIDVRAPIEYKNGAFLNSINLPIMDDKQREQVGTIYKQEGHEEAVKLGYNLVSGEVKKQRVLAWIDIIKQYPNVLLYCFRGGQRSQIAQQFIKDNGYDIVRLQGGYKALRNYLIEQVENSSYLFKPILLGGRSGSGKTILLNKLKNSIDLEGLANHRGSSFGRKITPQPTQINFENNLAYKFIQKINQGHNNLIFEDEGKYVGKIYIPKKFAQHLTSAPLIILQTPTQQRVETTFDEYIVQAQKLYNSSKDYTLDDWAQGMKKAIFRIRKRLGDEKYQVLDNIFENALKKQKQSSSLEGYKEFVQFLLQEYYDPMYDYQIKKRSNKILFKGTQEEIFDFLHTK